MGTKIKGMVSEVKRKITLKDLETKTLAVDAFNTIYQFLTTIKGRNGRPLMDSEGRITSHLNGLLYRNINLMEAGIKLIYCFDGIKKSRKIRWENKPKENKIRINEEIIKQSKLLLNYMGIPYVQGISEGEAQCCHLVKKGDAWGVVSQDYDCLAFGGERLIRNLSIGKTKKVKGEQGYTTVKVEIEYVNLEKFLEKHDITREQLVDISIAAGNDFFSGFKGYGEKTALKNVKKYGEIESFPKKFIVKDLDMEMSFQDVVNKIAEIRDLFLNPKVNEDYEIKFSKPKYKELKDFLVKHHDFSIKRIDTAIERLKKINSTGRVQTSLAKFIGLKL